MDIRKMTEAEEKESLYVWSQAFERGDREMDEWREWNAKVTNPHRTFGVWDAAGMQTAVLIVDFRVHLGPEIVAPLVGVNGVACLPAARGRGYAAECIQYALAQMRDAGQSLSALEAFSWEFYQRLGWEWTGARRRYAMPSRILKPDPETENVRAATLADRPALQEAYTRFAGRYRGMIARNDSEWGWILDDRDKQYTYTYLYEQDGQVEGYLTYRGGKEDETRLREFISLTPRAQRALLGLLRRHEMQINKFVWSAPPDDPLWLQFYHWDIETKLAPNVMLRIVDVPGALQLWRPSESARGAVNLAVQDAAAPWNTRTWRAEFEGGEVSVRPTDAAPQVSLDIRALSQAYFGTPNLTELRAAERLTVHDEAGFTALCALLDGPPMWINDGF